MTPLLRRFAGRFELLLGHAPAAPISAPLPPADRAQFKDVRRRIAIYLRALWGQDFIIAEVDPAAAAAGSNGPYIEGARIHLPDVFFDCRLPDTPVLTGLEIYRAAAVHAAAHIVFSHEVLSSRSLDKLQVAAISLIEDARIEALSMRRFPGLRALWAAQHCATPMHDKTAGDYLARLARALADESYRDDDLWVAAGRELFKAVGDLEDAEISRSVGLELADALAQRRFKATLRPSAPSALYRDDNRYLWNRREPAEEIVNPYLKGKAALGESKSDARPKGRRSARSGSAAAARETVGVYCYPEWNYRFQLTDPSWVTVREPSCAAGDPALVDAIVAANAAQVARIRNLLNALRDSAAKRVRKLEDGAEIDVNAAVLAQVDLRLGMQPDPRIMMRSRRKNRDIAVLMLLDMSGSMNRRVPDRAETALQLAQQSGVLLAEAADAVGDAFAIHGFSSETRHNVEYYRLKDFDQPYNEMPKARIAGMECQLSTRLGAAIRHASYHLNSRKSGKRLLLLFSDGQPSDVDVTDPRYLRDDARKAVDEASRRGIYVYCISFDPAADEYVTRIFGAKNYLVVDHIRALPEKLLLLYAGLTRR